MDLSLNAGEQAFLDEASSWLEDNYVAPPSFADADAEVAWGRQWQATLAGGRWVGLDWPAEYGGRGANPIQVALFNMAYGRTGAPQPVNRVGLSHAGPTILAHGTPQQKARWLPPALTANEIWCQLFSEPDAGSDLAALSTKATPTEDGWVLNGQKVWTSYAQYARWGICLARTDPDVAKHRGISFLIVDMTAPGIEIRPLVQMTGEAEFSEVFFDDVHVPADCIIGEPGQGWRVAGTTLAHERGINFPVKEQVVHEVYFERLLRQAIDANVLDDPLHAEDVGRVWARLRLLQLANLRTLTRVSAGEEPGAESSVVKMQWAHLTQDLSHVADDLLGEDADWERQYLWSRVASVAGGTSEVQRTIIGEHLLGLPRGH